MSGVTRDVTREYELARAKAEVFDPGAQPDIAGLMKAAYTHGYARALLDMQDGLARKEADKTCRWREVKAHGGARRYRTDCGFDEWPQHIFPIAEGALCRCGRPLTLKTDPLKQWQHDETGRVCESPVSPGPRWFEVKGP
jgi:hypothetical protein